MNIERKEYSFMWSIENYSYCWHKNGEFLRSPNFIIDGMEGAVWYLKLYPRGRYDSKLTISLFLCMSKKDGVPKNFSFKFELSVLAADGSAVHSCNCMYDVTFGIGAGIAQLVQIDEIRNKAIYLPNDTLSVCCKMWKGEKGSDNIVQIFARTRLKIEKISFLHVVESFSTLQPNEKQTIQIRSYSKEGRVVSSSLHFTDGSCCEEKIMIEIAPSDNKQILQKCEFSLLDGSGNEIECGGVDYRYSDGGINIYKFPLSLARKVLLSKKSEYLPDDNLSLLCECIFSTGLLDETIEETLNELPLTVIKCKRNQIPIKDAYKSQEKFSEFPSVSENLKAIYIKQYLTDVDLKTKTKSYPAHKIVLCASSPVFEAMMTSDMKEKNTNCIEIDDLENDTVEQLLLFLYSDKIEKLEWKSATQLYYAADKYQIGKLKAMCSSFLIVNLTVFNASDLLLLADSHNDSSLKKVVEDFILKHEKQVFGSNGWEKLIETNPQLVIKTMHLKYKRKNETN